MDNFNIKTLYIMDECYKCKLINSGLQDRIYFYKNKVICLKCLNKMDSLDLAIEFKKIAEEYTEPEYLLISEVTKND